ncbi:hypothetical protein AB0G00_10015 [Nocardia salmonicida]|uniref:hypothetical protein n=1 Tax=Nocardia salmonicida TaxID=53431 RepID=UPI0033E0EBB8
MVSLIWILWPFSVIFTAVLCYRVGAYWSSTDTLGRHRAGVASGCDNLWDTELTGDEDEAEELSIAPLAKGRAIRWWSDEDDTEVLPRV